MELHHGIPSSPLSCSSWLEDGVKEPFEALVTAQLGGSTLRGWSKVLQKVLYSGQHPVYGAISLIARIRRSRYSSMQMGVTPLTIVPSDPWAKCLLPVPSTLLPAGPEVWLPEGGKFPPGVTAMTPLNWKLSQLLGPLELLRPLKQQAKKGVMVLAGVTAPVLKGKLGYSSRMEVRKSRSGIQKISEGVSQSYYVQQPVFKENCNNPIQTRLIVAQTIQEWRFGSPHHIKKHDQPRCLLKAKGIRMGSRSKEL